MSYQSPTISPSGTNFSQLRSGGYYGQVNRLIDSNAFSPAVRSLMLGSFDNIQRGIVSAVDAFLQGDPVSTSDINAKLMTYATALKALATALDEANALINANPGALKNLLGLGASGRQKRRIFS